MQTVFVTGAGGFVGSRLLEYLRARGYDVVAGVRNRARKLAYERQHGKALVCDVTDPINVARAIASVQPHGVIHLASVSRPVDASQEPLIAYQAIDTSWANILDAVRRVVPRARVVMASASDVYGNAGASGNPIAETTPPQPISTFGSLKATAETIAHTFFRDYHLDVTIARPFYYTGPGQPDRFYFGAVASRLATWDPAVNGHDLSVPDLSCRRDVLHVDDLVVAYERLLCDGKPDETYNICSGQTRTCRELIDVMLKDVPHQVNLAELPAEQGNRQIPVLCGDNTKLRGLNWAPTRTAEDAVRELLASCRVATAAPVAS